MAKKIQKMTGAERTEKITDLQREAAAARNRARYETDATKKAADIALAEKAESEAKALEEPAQPEPAPAT